MFSEVLLPLVRNDHITQQCQSQVLSKASLAKKPDDFQCHTALLWGAGSSRYLQNLTLIYIYPKEVLNSGISTLRNTSAWYLHGFSCEVESAALSTVAALSLEHHKTPWPLWPPCSTARSHLALWTLAADVDSSQKISRKRINRVQYNICTISLLNYTVLRKSQLNNSSSPITF